MSDLNRSALTTSDEAIVAEVRDEWASRPAEEIRAEYDRLNARMTEALDQAMGSVDVNAVTALNTSDASETTEAFVKLNSRLGGLVDALNQRNTIDAVGTDVLNRRLPGDLEIRDITPDARLSDDFVTALEGVTLSSEGDRVDAALDLDIFNATMTSTGGYPAYPPRGEAVSFMRAYRLLASGLLRSFPISSNAYIYPRQSAGATASEKAAEGTATSEQTLTWANVTDPTVTLQAWVPASEEQLEDEPSVRMLIEEDLSDAIRVAMESKVVEDILGTTGIQSVNWKAALANPFQTLRSAITLCAYNANNNVDPNAILINPSVMDAVLASAESVANAFPIGYFVEGLAERIHGLPVVRTNDLVGTATTGHVNALVGNFQRGASLAMRRDARVVAGHNGTDFTKGQVTLRADARVAVPVFRPTAFCRVRRP